MADLTERRPRTGVVRRWIFYRNGHDQLVAVRYEDEDEFTYGSEEVLFSTSNHETDFYHRSYDVTPDGQRFVMIRALEHEPGVLDVVIVENWFRELRDAMAAAGRRPRRTTAGPGGRSESLGPPVGRDHTIGIS